MVLLNKRLKEFPGEGLISRNGCLFCIHCSVEIDFSKSSTVKNHLKSKSHEKRKGSNAQQPNIDTAVNSQLVRTSLWSNMAAIFVGAGVPLHIFRIPRLRRWLSTNVKQRETLPSESTLRRYLAKEGDNDIVETRSICKDKDVIVIVDETQDLKNRKVVNLLVAPAEYPAKFRLLYTKFLDKCDAESIVQFVINGLNFGNIPMNHLIAFISDNAIYMVSAGKTIQQINSRAIHSTCWAHILHLAAEDIRASLELADQLIAKVKACLVKAPSRRAALLSSLENLGKEKRLPPTPVITRWTIWLETGDYLFKNFLAICDWVTRSDPDSVAMQKLKELVLNENLTQELEGINLVYQSLASAIKTLEGNDIPASDVMLLLETIRGILELLPLLEHGLDKLDLYLTTKHPSLSFWNDVQFFDPRKMWKFGNNDQLPTALAKFGKEKVSVAEIICYKSICNGFTADPDFHPPRFWINHSRELPVLSALALKLLAIPATSAEVERSFSHLNRILTPARSSLTEDNLGIHLRLQFNNRESVEKARQEDEQVEL